MLVRKGECCRCGDCCKGDPITGRDKGEHGVQLWCPNLRFNDDATTRCEGRDTAYYKGGCIDFPSKPIHLKDLPRCTYFFVEE